MTGRNERFLCGFATVLNDNGTSHHALINLNNDYNLDVSFADFRIASEQRLSFFSSF